VQKAREEDLQILAQAMTMDPVVLSLTSENEARANQLKEAEDGILCQHIVAAQLQEQLRMARTQITELRTSIARIEEMFAAEQYRHAETRKNLQAREAELAGDRQFLHRRLHHPTKREAAKSVLLSWGVRRSNLRRLRVGWRRG
jgi:hypothetical protein